MRRALVVPLLAVTLLCAASVQAGKRDLKIEGKMPADYVAAQAGRAWAVVIGIDEYEKAPRLKYAVADAKAMAGLLQQQGFQVTGLYDKQATRNAIVGELGDKLSARVGEQDRVVIFYAGHGETKKARGGKEMGFLIPVNGQQEALAETGISMGLIRELSDALPSKQVLFLVDVCYGGIAGQQFRSMPPMTEDYLRIITRERGRQLITAGGADQQAMEAPEWGHSVFTYYLLEGLGKGFADLNNDGIIPASELYSYLDSRVFGAAKLKGHTQRPELWALAAEKGEFVFIPRAGAAAKQPPAASAGSAGSAELEAERQRLQAERDAFEREKREAGERARLDAERLRIEEERKRLVEERRQAIKPREEARARPYQTPEQLDVTPKGYFTMGSTKNEVLKVQGTPAKPGENRWEYGYSWIRFQNDRVIEWYNSPVNPLKVQMIPGSSAFVGKNYFTMGSTKNEVLKVQGTPAKPGENRWEYGYSWIRFQNDRVIEWYNSPVNPLKVKMTPSGADR